MSVAPVGAEQANADALSNVAARMAEIQARFGTGPTPTPSGSTAGGSGIDFGALLASQLGDGRRASSVGGGSGDPIVGLAERYLGTPYQWGGSQPGGFDCSGLVQYVYGQAGVDLPRTAADQAQVGQPVASLAAAQPGDLVAFGQPVDHIGIYAGNGMMVAAPKTGDVVKLQPVFATPTAIRRVLPSSSGSLGTDSPGTDGPGTGGFDIAALLDSQRMGALAALGAGGDQ